MSYLTFFHVTTLHEWKRKISKKGLKCPRDSKRWTTFEEYQGWFIAKWSTEPSDHTLGALSINQACQAATFGWERISLSQEQRHWSMVHHIEKWVKENNDQIVLLKVIAPEHKLTIYGDLEDGEYWTSQPIPVEYIQVI